MKANLPEIIVSIKIKEVIGACINGPSKHFAVINFQQSVCAFTIIFFDVAPVDHCSDVDSLFFQTAVHDW